MDKWLSDTARSTVKGNIFLFKVCTVPVTDRLCNFSSFSLLTAVNSDNSNNIYLKKLKLLTFKSVDSAS